MPANDALDQLKKDAWDEAVHCCGTAHIFRRRAVRYRFWVKGLVFLGMAVPVIIGGVALSYGIEFKALPILIGIAGVFGLLQLFLSVCSLVYGWDDEFAYAQESVSDNLRLSDSFSSVGKDQTTGIQQLKLRYEVLRAENKARSDLDERRSVSEKERRFGMKYALRQFQRRCQGCGEIPTSMDSTPCPVCGNFSAFRLRHFLHLYLNRRGNQHHQRNQEKSEEPMGNRVTLVLNGYMNLTEEEQKELLREIDKYNRSRPGEKTEAQELIEKSIKRITLGPLGGACTCCGRAL